MQLNALADQVVVLVKNALGPLVERIAGLEARLSVLGDLRDRVVTVETKAAMPSRDVSDVVEAMLSRLGTLEARAANPSTTDLVMMEIRDKLTAADITTDLSALRDRVVTMETKAAMSAPAPTPVDVSPLLERLQAAELRLEMRLTETAPLIGAIADLTKDLSAVRERVAVVEVRPVLPGPPGEPGQPGKDGADGTNGAAGLSFEGVYQDGKSYELGHLVTWAGSSWHCNEATTTKPGDGSKDWTLMVKRGQNGRDGRDAPGALPVMSVGRPQ